MRGRALWVAAVFSLATSVARADDGTWAFPVGSADSGSGWFVTIGLGDSWTSSSGKAWRGHLAEDWFKSSGSSLGQPVYAAAAGQVVVVRQNCGSYVDVVVIEHVVGSELVYSLYGHLEADSFVAEGDEVQKRQQIGVIGQPVVFVPHVHFSIFNRTAFLNGPHSNCTLPEGRYVASGYSGISNDYDASFDYYDPSNDGVADNRFYHPGRFINDHQTPTITGDNVARGAINWLASSVYSAEFGGSMAYDGVVSSNSKWVSDGSSAESWLAIDLGGLYDLDGVVVRHAGSGGEPAYVNTLAYRIESGDSLNGPWSVLASVDNASGLDATTSVLAGDSERYVRLYITDAGVDDYARIVELEVYGTATAPPPPPPPPSPIGDNVALGSVGWSASSTYNADTGGDKAFDGVVSADSKWTSNGASPESWLALDLGAEYAIESFVVRHGGAGGEASYYNTASFRLEHGGSLAGPWTSLSTVDNVTGDDWTFVGLGSPQTARYVRLVVIDAGIDDYARIPELEVYGSVVAPAQDPYNVALDAVGWTASSTYNADTGGDKAFDGVVSADSKWTSNGASPESWLALDLGAEYAIESFIVRHAGAGGEESYYNTASFRLEHGSSLAGPWTSLPAVDNGSGDDWTFVGLGSPKTTRFVRLVITDAGVDNYARIPELEVYGTPSAGAGGN